MSPAALHQTVTSVPITSATPPARCSKQQSSDPGYVGLDDIAHYLGLAVSTVARHLVPDGLPHVRAGRRYLFRIEDVDSWMAARASASRAQAVALIHRQWLEQGPPGLSEEQVEQIAHVLASSGSTTRQDRRRATA